MNHAELAEKVHVLLDHHTAVDQFSGALLIAHEHQPILTTGAGGFAIHPDVLPNQSDTKFNIASVTKMLTAVAVMQLVAAGKLDLHTPVAAYDRNLPHASQITVHQLLTHTAGFGRYWNDAYHAARSDLRTVADYIKLFAATPLEFAPGTRHHYGNAGYVVLGAVIEQVTGASYYDHMRQAVYQPAAMCDTDHFELDLPIADRAVGYTNQHWCGPTDGRRHADHFIYGVKGSPAEHCFSTVGDLFRFFQALRPISCLMPSIRIYASAHTAAEQPGVSYGYGFHIIDDGRHGLVVGHGGRALGGDAFALLYLDLGYTVAILSNCGSPTSAQDRRSRC